MMIVHRSNRAEALASSLASLLLASPAGPLERETVVVLSQGMGRWLSMQLSQRIGIAANIDFPFPAEVVQRAFAAALGDEGSRTASWSRGRLPWSVLLAMRSLIGHPAMAPLARYLDAEGSEVVGRRQVQLARRIADTFDRYITYRPELVRSWDTGTGDDPDWQPLLWQGIRAATDGPHQAELFERLAAAVTDPQRELAGFPRRITVFGVTALPPFTLDVLQLLATRCEVHLFVLCPSKAWWGHVQDKRSIARALRRAEASGRDDELHLEQGHPLLASLGRLGRDFQVVLEGSAQEPYHEPPADLFTDPGEDTLLHALQSDVLHLRHRGGPGAEHPPLPIAPGDRSVRLHACHGPLRQVEVLRDELVALFDELPGLNPRDIVVMTPDIEAYAPLFDAVFSDQEPAIPFRVVDRSLRRENEVARAVLATLELVAGRLPASGMLDLLSLEPVRRRFGIAAEDLPTIAGWVRESGIRWGLDAAHREEHEQPAYAENTWRFGLDRLLLGVAMPEDGPFTFAGVLPFDRVEGGAAQLVGRFADFCEVIFDARRTLRAPAPPAVWRDRLSALLEALCHISEEVAQQAQQVRDALAELAREPEEVGFTADLTLEATAALLDGQFEGPGEQGGFLSGELTFCALVPMRSIPFRVVCIVGMDDGAFPRAVTQLGFDRIAEKPRVGDRTPREDDRTMFLEALLSARDRLIITWTGRGARDNEPLPPAGPVDELLDVLSTSFVAEGASEPFQTRARLVREHPLQPFSPRCFGVTADGGRMVSESHDARFLEGARALQGPRAQAAGFVTGPLPHLKVEGQRVINVRDLARFLMNPIGHLLTTRLGVRFEDSAEEIEDREPAELGPLSQWAVADRLLDWTLRGFDTDQAYEGLRASGALPLGAPGLATFQAARALAEPVAEAVRELRGGERIEPAEVDLDLGPVRLTGRVEGLWESGALVLHQASRVRAKHRLGLWARHLALCAMGRAAPSHLAGKAAKGKDATCVTLRPVAPGLARGLLGALCGLYVRGLEVPLLFFPETSNAFAEVAFKKPGEHDKALGAARAAWRTTRDNEPSGEGTSAEAVRLFGEASPWPCDPEFALPGITYADSERFEALSTAILRPLFDHMDEAS